jgi:hypothetical protein
MPFALEPDGHIIERVRQRRRGFGSPYHNAFHCRIAFKDVISDNSYKPLQQLVCILSNHLDYTVDDLGVVHSAGDFVCFASGAFCELQPDIKTEKLSMLAFLGQKPVMSKDLEAVDFDSDPVPVIRAHGYA